MTGQTFTVELDIRGAAFEDMPGAELARILRKLADKLEAEDTAAAGVHGALFDVNGNRCGSWLWEVTR
jgi:hypothetical protein